MIETLIYKPQDIKDRMSFLFYHILSAIGLYHSMMLTYVFTNYPLGELTQQWKMAIEIVDFPMKNGDFPQLCQFTRGYDLKKTSIIHVSLQSALNPCRPGVGPLSDTAANCHSPSDMITSTSTWRGGPGGRDMTLGL